MYESGLAKIETGKKNGSWILLDAVEDLIMQANLGMAFNKNSFAFENCENLIASCIKSYLYWHNQVKREKTRNNRIIKIIDLCTQNKKYRD